MIPNKWHVPYSHYLEVVVGGSVFSLEPQWTSDPITDIENAIRNSTAPVKVDRAIGHAVYTITGNGVEALHLNIGGIDRLQHADGLLQAPLNVANAATMPPAGQYSLLAGYDVTTITLPAAGLAALAQAIQAAKAPVWLSGANPLMIQATKTEARWLQLRKNAGDPASNILDRARFTGGSALFDDRLFQGATKCYVVDATQSQIVDFNAGAVETALQKAPFTYRVEVDRGEQLLLTSKRLGSLQLRSSPGKPETNMLNSAEEWSCGSWVCFDKDLFFNSWRGVLLTWILLSLGAPFWYDALKDMLKLRSGLAKKEEDARTGRQTAGAAT